MPPHCQVEAEVEQGTAHTSISIGDACETLKVAETKHNCFQNIINACEGLSRQHLERIELCMIVRAGIADYINTPGSTSLEVLGI